MESKRMNRAICLLLSLWLVTPLQTAPRQNGNRNSMYVEFKEFTLTNRLRVLLSEDRSAPVISICITYDAGSRDEQPGRTGLAHLLEHMMFQGSANVGKGEHMILVRNQGGTVNATTHADRTNYFETLPSNQLDLALFLEADRMRTLAVNQVNLTISAMRSARRSGAR